LVNGDFAGSTAAASLLVKLTVPEYPVNVLPELSIAVTVKLKDVPVVAEAGALTPKCIAPVATLIELLTPVSVALDVSVAVMVWLPGVLNVAENVPWPAESIALDGNKAWASVLVKRTVPE
jgi:hypothetical protein